MVAPRQEYRYPQQDHHIRLFMNQHHRQVQYPNLHHMDQHQRLFLYRQQCLLINPHQHHRQVQYPIPHLMNQHQRLLIHRQHCLLINPHQHHRHFMYPIPHLMNQHQRLLIHQQHRLRLNQPQRLLKQSQAVARLSRSSQSVTLASS